MIFNFENKTIFFPHKESIFAFGEIIKRILFFMIFALNVFAQNLPTNDTCSCTLSGRITDSETHENLLFAHIHIEEVNRVTMSDTLGRYSIEGLCAGVYTLHCTHLGCLPFKQKIIIEGNTKLDCKMPHSIYNLAEIEIKSEKYIPKSTQAGSELSEREMALGRGENLGTMLEKMPGVASLQTGTTVAKPVINGLHSQRIVLINNGVRQEGQQWGMEHAPEIDPFAADKLTVVKGANSVRYGSEAIGGVIIAQSRPLRYVGGLSGEVNTAFFSNGRGGTLSARLDGNFRFLPAIAWRVQGTLKKMGDFRTPDYFLKNTGSEEYNYVVSLGYKRKNYQGEIFYSQYNTKLGVFVGAHIGNLTDLQAAIGAAKPAAATQNFSYNIGRPFQYAEHELVRLSNTWKAGKAGIFSLNFARQFNRRSEYDARKPYNDSLAALNNPELKLYVQTYTGDFVWEAKPTKGWRVSSGFSALYQHNDYKGRFLIPEYHAFTAGTWAIARKRYKKIEAEAGLRHDYRHLTVNGTSPSNDALIYFTQQEMSGSAGLLFRPDSIWQITAYCGTAWRGPHVSELYSYGVHHGAASFEIGNPSLGIERALNNSIALVMRKKMLDFTINIYYNFINNFIYLEPIQPPTLTIRGAFPTFAYRQTDAIFGGIDWAVRLTAGRGFALENKGSYVDARQRVNRETIPLTPPLRIETALQYQWKENKVMADHFATVALQYVGRKTGIAPESDYLPPPNAYFLLRAEWATRLKLGQQQLKVALTAQNLLNTRYRNYMNRFRYFADEIGLNIGLKIAYSF